MNPVQWMAGSNRGHSSTPATSVSMRSLPRKVADAHARRDLARAVLEVLGILVVVHADRERLPGRLRTARRWSPVSRSTTSALGTIQQPESKRAQATAELIEVQRTYIR
jgi:hypothetical protein